MTKLQLSRLRQTIRSLKARRNTLEHIAMAHRPMVAASFIKRYFRQTGVTAYFLSIPTPQNSWHRYVRKDEFDYYRQRAAAWSEFTNGMAEWVRINKEIEKLLRKLGKGRCEKLEIRRRSKGRKPTGR